MLGRVCRSRFALPAAGLMAVGSWLAGVPVAAAPPEGGAFAACAADLAKMCPGVEAGGGKKMRCLQQNQTQLSPACDAAVKARIEARVNRLGGPAAATAVPPAPAGGAEAAAGKSGRLGKACQTELAAMCGAETGGKRMACLTTNEAKLGPACAAVVAQRKQVREVAKAACVTDAATFCATSKGPERLRCLETNKAKLSPACLGIVEKRAARQAASPQSVPPKQ